MARGVDECAISPTQNMGSLIFFMEYLLISQSLVFLKQIFTLAEHTPLLIMEQDTPTLDAKSRERTATRFKIKTPQWKGKRDNCISSKRDIDTI